ncbi:uncharacterized protein LOC112638391 [Camponotus floridanus]|uniref:uncharacterized protein LOC112638391 n=1 Tax=Camponotus floridanus TaxID=104421 RepID=UPI000DC6657A|nr:uncharacterized protein LOC112638391 [Camponotus floridanus]
MKHHLKNAHNIEIENQDWMLHYNYTISNETMECNYCKIIFQNDVKHNYFNAIKHFNDAHQIAGRALEFRSTRNAEDVVVPSGCHQPTYSGNYYGISSLGFSTNTTDTLTTSYNNFSYLDRNAKNVTASSRYQQPTYDWNHYGISFLSSGTNDTDISSTNPIDTSITSHQPIHNCYQLDYSGPDLNMWRPWLN